MAWQLTLEVEGATPGEIERVRQASRFWAAIWWAGDAIYYMGFAVLFFGPVSTVGPIYRDAITWREFLMRLGTVILVSMSFVPIGIATGLVLKALSRRKTGVSVE